MSKPFVPFMERLTPAQKRRFRAGMARLRRQFEKKLRDAKRFEKQSRKARIVVGHNNALHVQPGREAGGL